MHRLHFHLSLVCLLYPVDLFKYLLYTGLALRARQLAVG
jgi:hypothetical protein